MKKYIIGGVVILVVGLLLVIGLGGQKPQSPQPAFVGDDNLNSTRNFNTPICHANGNVCEDWAGDKIYAKTNQAYWKNTTGKTQYVDQLDVSTDGVASSTFNIWAVATSSALANAYDFTAPLATSTTLINNFSFSTTSVATTTSSLDKAPTGRVIAVPDGSQVNIYLRSADGPTCNPQGVKCETATSTNRGFNLFWRLHYHN